MGRREDALLAGVSSWEDFTTTVNALPTTKRKGDAFERLVQLYLEITPEQNYEKVWLLEEVPAKVHRELNLPGPDEGIDLVAQTSRGDYHAIQAKYRADTSRALTREQLATFTELTYVICRGFSCAKIATTTDLLPQLYGKATKQLRGLRSDVWENLPGDFWKNIQSRLQGYPAIFEPHSPRQHQVLAVDECAMHLREHDRGKLIMPCGTGKTLTAFWISQELKAKSILVVVPSLALIQQTLKEWLREFTAHNAYPQWLCVCGTPKAAEADEDSLTLSTQDLEVESTTKARDIRAILDSGKNVVVFSTYQSGKPLAEACRAARFEFDLAVFDEAHRTAGVEGRSFSHLLADHNIAIKRRLFMTATPRHYAGESDDVFSMDDAGVYGEEAHALTFVEALDYDDPPILSDCEVWVTEVRDEDISDLVERGRGGAWLELCLHRGIPSLTCCQAKATTPI